MFLARRAWALLGLAALVFSGCLARSTQVTQAQLSQPIRPQLPGPDAPLGERIAAAEIAPARPGDEVDALVAALRTAAVGRTGEALAQLEELEKKADPDVREVAAQAESELLVTQQRWGELARLADGPLWSLAHAPDSGGFFDAVRAWAQQPPAQIHFASESSELELLGGSPVVEVRVGGHSLRFLVDTGAATTTVIALGGEYGVRSASSRPVRVATSTEALVDAYPVTIAHLQIGGAELTDWPALRIERLSPEAAVVMRLMDVSGVLGWDVLRRLDVELDSHAKRMLVRKPHPQQGIRNLVAAQLPLVRALHLDGHAGLFVLDTGAQHSFAMPALLARLSATESVVQVHAGAGGAEYGVVRNLPKLVLQLAGRTLVLRNVREIRQLGSLGVMADGLLGQDLLDAGRLRIDGTNGRLELLPLVE